MKPPTAEAKARLLRALPIFAGLDVRMIGMIAAAAVPRNWPAGALMFQRGDAGDYMFIVTSGRVRLSLVTPHGRELILRYVGPREMLGEMAVLDGQARSSDAVAVQAVTGYALSRADYMRLCQLGPDLPLAAARYLCGLLRETNDKLESFVLYDLQARMARFFLVMLRQRHGDVLPDRAELRLDMTQGDLAAMLGASRPKVNRALNGLIEQGAMTRDDVGLSCDTIALTQVAERDPNHGEMQA